MMILEIPTELEVQLERAARERGTDARTLALETVQRAFSEQYNMRSKEDKRRAAINRLYGRLAGSDFTVDGFLRERSEEGRKEAGL